MDSTFIEDSPPTVEEDDSCAVEYTLTLSDFHALDMFLFDTVLSKQLRFRLKFYGINTLLGAFLPALCGLIVWGAAVILTSTNGPVEIGVGCLAFLSILSPVLVGLLPGGYYDKKVRRVNEKRFWRHRERLLRVGLLKSKQTCRVLLTPEGFTETLVAHEKSDAVEITESKTTKVLWVAVSNIAVMEDYAFFTVENAGVSFTTQGFLVLPRLAFVNETSFREFVSRAQHYREAVFQTATAALPLRPPRDSRITS